MCRFERLSTLYYTSKTLVCPEGPEGILDFISLFPQYLMILKGQWTIQNGFKQSSSKYPKFHSHKKIFATLLFTVTTPLIMIHKTPLYNTNKRERKQCCLFEFTLNA